MTDLDHIGRSLLVGALLRYLEVPLCAQLSHTFVGPVVWLNYRAIHLWHPSAAAPISRAKQALLHRYAAARGHPETMRGVIAASVVLRATHQPSSL